MNMQSKKPTPPMVSVVGNSGSGKTTFLEKLIPEIKRRGFKVGTIKHDVHGFDMDKPGKDSWRHKQAGAAMTIISSPYQIGMVMDVNRDHDPDELLPLFSNVDIVLVEGFKKRKMPKMEIFRPEISQEIWCKGDENLIALISDENVNIGVPRFSTDDNTKVADFLVQYFDLTPGKNNAMK